MDDTISRQAAIDEIRKCRFVVDAIEKIGALPSVDAVEIVRCKNCKHFNNNFAFYLFCKHKDGLDNVTSESFCSYGEKKDVEVH